MSDLTLSYSGNYLVAKVRGIVGKYHGACFLSSPSNNTTPYGQQPYWYKKYSGTGFVLHIQCYSALNFLQDGSNFLYNCFQLVICDWEITTNLSEYAQALLLVSLENKIASSYDFVCEPNKLFIKDSANNSYKNFIESDQLDSLAFRMFSSLKPNSFSSFIN